MSTLADIQAQIEEAARIERDATIRLVALLPPGAPIEFKYGNMACVHNAVVIRVCAYQGLGVVLANVDTGTERKVPVSAIIDRPSSADKPPVSFDPPTCDLCVRGLKPGEDRYECPCGNIFVREKGGINVKVR